MVQSWPWPFCIHPWERYTLIDFKKIKCKRDLSLKNNPWPFHSHFQKYYIHICMYIIHFEFYVLINCVAPDIRDISKTEFSWSSNNTYQTCELYAYTYSLVSLQNKLVIWLSQVKRENLIYNYLKSWLTNLNEIKIRIKATVATSNENK